MSPDTLWQRSEEAAVIRSAHKGKQAVQQVSTPFNEDDLSVKVKLTVNISTSIACITDIGTWFPGNEGDEHIRIV